MVLTDDELRARMVAEAEAAMDRLLAKRKPAETITLREIEQLVLAAREAVGEQWAQELVMDNAGRLPYQQAQAVFARIGHRDLPRTSLWRRTQAHGAARQRRVAHEREQVAPERVVLPGPGQDHAQVKGVSVDGGMMHLRDAGWKEFKVGTVFDVVMQPGSDPHTGEAVDQPGATHTGYTAVRGEVSAFAPARWKLAVDQDVPIAARSSVSGDGAAGMGHLVADSFPDSVPIVDGYPADAPLAAAHALYPDDEAQAMRGRHHLGTGRLKLAPNVKCTPCER